MRTRQNVLYLGALTAGALLALNNRESRTDKELKLLLNETRNPYVARILTSISLSSLDHNSNSLEESVQRIKEERTVGVIDSLDKINAGGVYSGGTGLGFEETGALLAMLILRIKTKMDVGSSIGAVTAKSYRLNMLKMQKNEFDLDAALNDAVDFSVGLGESLGIGSKGIGLAKYRVLFSDSIMDRNEMIKYLEERLGHYTLKELPGLHIIVTQKENGRYRKLVLNSQTAPDERLDVAIAKSTAHPLLFGSYTENGKVFLDGGLSEECPCQTALNQGADLMITTLVNYFRRDSSKSGWKPLKAMFGYIDGLKDSNYDSMIERITNKDPFYVADCGDPTGRIILNMPNLSWIDSYDLHGCQQLITHGIPQMQSVLLKFLDPDFKHKEYSASGFLKQHHLEKMERKYSLKARN